MRIGVIGIQHESNSFVEQPTTMPDFHRGHLLEGEAIVAAMRAAHHEMGGYFQAIAEAGATAAPLFYASAMPSGPINSEVAEDLTARAVEAVASAGALDGLLVAAHGAAVSQSHADFDGYWLSRIRAAAGKLPIVCTIDPHANVSPKMIESCDAMIAYRTNPHIDQRDCGVEAGRLLLRIIREKLRPATALSTPPMIINIERQRTAHEPCASLYAQAKHLRDIPGVLAVSIVLGFPYADVAEMGTSFIVTTEGRHDLAQQYADALAMSAWDRRTEFEGHLRGIDAAIAKAAHSTGLSVLLDMGDNVGGGSPGDGTLLAAALERACINPSIVTIYDPATVAQADRVGAGATARFMCGGKHDPRLGPPLEVQATVLGMFDGCYTESQPRHGGGTNFNMGRTAVLKTQAGLTLIATTRRVFPVSLGQYACCNIDLPAAKAVVVKGVHAPAAAYEPIAARLIHVNTPGSTTADLSAFTFLHRRKPMFPFEHDTTWQGKT